MILNDYCLYSVAHKVIKYSMRWIEKIMDLSLNISTNSDYDKFSSFSDQLDIIDLSIGQSTR